MKILVQFIFTMFLIGAHSESSLAQTIFTPDANAIYTLRSKGAGMQNLDVHGAKAENGTNISLYGSSEKGFYNQHFRFVDAGGGYYRIETTLKVGMAIDIYSARTADNSNANLWEKNDNNAQRFQLLDGGNGYVKIVSALGDNLYLGVSDDNRNVVLRNGDKGDRVLFKLNRVKMEPVVDVHEIPQSGLVGNNTPIKVTSFNGAMGGTFLLDLHFFTTTYSTKAHIVATADLGQQTILVSKYSHFASNNTNDPIVGNGTSTVTTQSEAYCKFKLYLDNNTLYLQQIMNPAGGSGKLRLETSSWKMVESSPAPILTGKITLINDPEKQETVIVEKITSGKSTPEFVGYLFPDQAGRKLTLDAKIGDRFVFRIEGQPAYKIDPYVVRQLEQRYTVKIGIRFMDARNPYKRIPNAQASRYSFDIFYITPEAIDKRKGSNKEGGMMEQIFEDLNDNDVDWHPYDGDYALKDQFELTVLDEGAGSFTEKTSYGMSSFKESFSFNIGVTGSIPGIGSLARSLGLDTSTEKEKRQKSVYSFARKDQKVYSIDLVPEKAVLHSNFKRAIRSLPVPRTMVQDTNQAKRDPAYAAFKKFISSWGTHYPKQTTYGGFILAYKIYTMEQLLEAESLGIKYSEKVEAEIKGTKVGRETDFSSNTSEKFEKMNSEHTSGYIYKGGQGDDNSWNVGDRVQPTHIQLERLHHLLVKRYFDDSDGISEEELKLKQKMLEMALTIYIGANSDNGTSLRPRVYRITVKNIENTGAEDRLKLYGNMQIFSIKDNSYINSTEFFQRGEANYLSINKNESINYSVSISQIVYPEGGYFNLTPYRFGLVSILWDQYNNDSDAYMGQFTEFVNFSAIPDNYRPIDVKLRCKTTAFNNVKEIVINAEVKRVSLSGFGFPN